MSKRIKFEAGKKYQHGTNQSNMIVFFDTETTGKYLWKLPPVHPQQPRIVSVGCVAYTDDGSQEMGSYYTLIKPDGWKIDNNSEAAKINGITHEMAMEYGTGIRIALRACDAFFHGAKYIGIFNADFDTKMYNVETGIIKLGNSSYKGFLDPKKTRCLKIAYTSICKLPPNPGFSDYKWPSLDEAYDFMFGLRPPGSHGALQDCKDTAALAFEAIAQGLWQWGPEQLSDK